MKSIAFLFYPKNFVFEENICENSTFVFHQKVNLFPVSSIAFQFYPKNFVFGEDWREYLWKFNFCISQKVCFLYPTQPGEKMCSEGFVNKLSANCSPQVESSWIECIQEVPRYMHSFSSKYKVCLRPHPNLNEALKRFELDPDWNSRKFSSIH